ncbi:MAG: glycosyltransferase family 2 protein [Candidatus Aenigmatarchaeota archaeon]
MSTAAVIPGYNEEETIGFVIRQTEKYVDEVIYVDDGSTDDTVEIAKKLGTTVITYGQNMGKGYALRVGFNAALEKDHDVIVTLDSDGQHDPAHIPNFLEKIKDADIVIGSRYSGHHYTIPRNVLGNFGLNFITNILSYGPQGFFRGQWLKDTQTGYRAFTHEALQKMNLKATEYAIESEMVYEAARNDLTVKEIPVRVAIRVRGVGIMDGIHNGLHVFKRRFGL